MTDTIVVSTDGSALGNPNGPMGWAWADHDRNAGDGGIPGHEHDAHGYDAGGATNGTNQIGELCAVLQALRAHPGAQPLTIETDSQYAINCSTTWVKGWKRNGWKNSQKKPVKNAELIKAIDAEIAKRPGPVKFVWVKGHAGNAGNELVDELARTYAGDCRSGARDGYLPVEGWQSLIASEYAKGLDVPPDVQLVLDGKAPANALRKPESDAEDAPSRPRSIAEALAEPEGVPDIAAASKPAQDRQPVETPDEQPAEQAPDQSAAAQSDAQSDEKPVKQPAKQPAARAAGNGLSASGTIRISPPPSLSPRWAGKQLHVTGMIAVDAPIEPDGTIVLDAAAFGLTSVRER